MDSRELQDDGGYGSRKFVLASCVIGIILLDGILAACWPAFRINLQTIVSGQVTALGIYSGARVTGAWLNGKNAVAHAIGTGTGSSNEEPEKDSEPEPEPEPEPEDNGLVC